MVSSDQLDLIKNMVFNRRIGPIQGHILEVLYLNSHLDFPGIMDRVCELSSEEISKKIKVPLQNTRHHIRVLEEKCFLSRIFIFNKNGQNVFVRGHKEALKKGIRGSSGQFYILYIIGEDR